ELQQVKAYADLVRRVQSSEGQSVLSQVAGQGAIVGGLIGGIPGAAIGAGIQSLAKPSRAIHQIATLAALSNRLGGVSKQVDTAIQRVTKPVTTGTRPRTGLVPASVLLFGSNAEQRKASFNRRARRIEQWRTDPAGSAEEFRARAVGTTLSQA